MATRERIQRIRSEAGQALKSFEQTFKEVEALAKNPANADKIDAIIAESGIPEKSFVDAFKRYYEAGGVVDYGVGRALAQGLTFGFSDEMEAAAKSAFGDKTYEQELGAIRAGKVAFEGAKPEEAMAAEITGAIPTMLLPMGLAARAPTLAGTMARGFGIGSAEGAVGEFGRAEGTPAQQGMAAGIGAMIGGPLGAVAPPLMAGGARVLRSGRSPETRASEQLGRIFPEERMPEAQQAVQQRIDVGDETPVTLTDIGGTEAARELRGLRGAQPQVQEMTDDFLRERTRSQGQRIEEQIETGAGVSPQESVVLGNVVRKQESDAAPLYQQLRESNKQVPVSGMESIFRSPAFKDVYQRTVNSMVNRADKGVDPDAIKQMADMSYDDFIRMLDKGDAFVPFDFLDQAKRNLGSLGQRAKRAGDNDLADQYFDVSRQVRDAADDRVRGYKDARAKFAGEAEIEEAMDLGRQFDRKTPAEIREIISDMNESQKRAFLSGAVDALRVKIGSTRRDRDLLTALNLDSPFQEQRLAAIMGGEKSPAFKAFMDAVKTEGRMAQTRGIVAGGSQTAAFQRDIGRAGVGFDEVVDLLMNPSSITNVGTLTRLFQGTINSIKGTGGDVGQQVARRLLTTDPQDQMRILKEIQDRRAQMQNTRRVVSQMGLGASGVVSQLPSLLDVGE